jgi:beta-lactamase superfamily II metal-dependent hydrolase
MPVQVLFDSGQSSARRAYRDCIARRGMRWSSSDGVTLDILAPALPFLADTAGGVNVNSVVAMLQFGKFRELFMGDAGEARLLAFGDDLRADVLKNPSGDRRGHRAHKLARLPEPEQG